MSDQVDGIAKFWDDYQEHGIGQALDGVRERSEDGNLRELELAVPYLVQEARDRDIDLIKFLTELDATLAEEKENATGVDNGASELRTDSVDEADSSQDEDESAEAQPADGEDREAE